MDNICWDEYYIEWFVPELIEDTSARCILLILNYSPNY